MKNGIKYLLQKSLGFKNYLYVFALFKIRTLKNDTKEKDFFHFTKYLVDGKGAVLDIGANIGIMSVHLSKIVPNSPIHAFEPIPDNVDVLRRIVQKFKLENVYIHEFAIGDQQGTVDMVLPVNSGTKMQGLSHVRHQSINDWNSGIDYKVTIDTLDNFMKKQKIQGIKIDVENFEYFALKGGEQIIRSNKPVIYAELWDNDNRKNCFQLLQSLSYSVNVVVNDELILFNSEIHTHQNFIFLPN